MFLSTVQNLQIAITCKLTMLTYLIDRVTNNHQKFKYFLFSIFYTSFETNTKRLVVFLTVDYCVKCCRQPKVIGTSMWIIYNIVLYINKWNKLGI